MQDNRNVIIAAVLAMAILFGWQYFIAGPQLEQAQRDAEYAAAQQQTEADSAALATPSETTATGTADTVPQSTATANQFSSREAAIAATPAL